MNAHPFRRVLIANRGEVAIRIAQACRRRGIESVAVYSEADRASPHVSTADHAFALPGSEARESYLAAELLLDIARRANADAIHPGYGFLAESPAFAMAVGEAGLSFIGPAPQAIATMGDKLAARRLVENLGLPVIPGANPVEQDDDTLCHAALSVGFPILVKAVAGGGGMGMRVVRSADELPGSIAAVRREAAAAFGDSRILLERYVGGVHHVEVQVIADCHGQVFHAFDRECSIQRRRQKVIEEAPSPNVDDAMRTVLCEAAIRIARAVDYEGLGTVEFIVDAQQQSFYFLEMNTRLQVEHAVTEAITGLDLVDLQLSVAQGYALPSSLAELRMHGHAMEARLYAENPAEGYLPSSGTVERWVPRIEACCTVMASVVEGSTVHAYYDPMLAKFVARGEFRAQTVRSLHHALAQSVVLGVQTNRELLLRVLEDEEFQRGEANTAFLERREDLAASSGARGLRWAADLPVLAFWEWLQDRESMAGLGLETRCYQYSDATGTTVALTVRGISDTVAEVDTEEGHSRVALLARDASGTLMVDHGGSARHYHFACRGAQRYFCARGGDSMQATLRASGQGGRTEAVSGHYLAPMPARVLLVEVKPGDRIHAGDSLCVLESMKMEHTLRAEADGVVEHVAVAPGDSVERGQELLSMERIA